MFVVVGATGHTGRVVAEELLGKGAAVRAWVRSKDKGQPLADKGAELALVDLGDDASVEDGLRGAEGAYLLLPPVMGSDDFLGHQAKVAERLTRAAKKVGLKHVVLLSSVGAQHPTGTGVIRSLHDFEKRIRAAAIPYTFVRAAYFQENWAGMLPVAAQDGVLPQMLGDADRSVAMVATRDIGLTAARALLEGPQGVIELEGPERYAPRDVAAAAAKVLGRDVGVVDVPFEAQEAQFRSFGMSADVAALMRELNEGVLSGRVDFEGGDAKHVTGKQGLSSTVAALL